jgi:ankyrin repeat protein
MRRITPSKGKGKSRQKQTALVRTELQLRNEVVDVPDNGPVVSATLLENILSIVSERDAHSEALASIHELQARFAKAGPLPPCVNDITLLTAELLQPFSLIDWSQINIPDFPRWRDPDEYFRLQRYQLASGLSAEHPALARLQTTKDRLTDRLSAWQTAPEASDFMGPLMTIAEGYIAYTNDLNQRDIEDVVQLLMPRARLTIIGSGVYYLDMAMGRRLLCQDAYGRPIKENELGNNAIAAVAGVHYKPNKGADPIMPNKEHAVCALHHVIAKEDQIVAPTALLKVDGILAWTVPAAKECVHQDAEAYGVYCIEVLVKQRDIADVFTELPDLARRLLLQQESKGYLVQAGLTITGVCLQEVVEFQANIALLQRALAADECLTILRCCLENDSRFYDIGVELIEGDIELDRLMNAFMALNHDRSKENRLTECFEALSGFRVYRIFQEIYQGAGQEAMVRALGLLHTYPALMSGQSLSVLARFPMAIYQLAPKLVYPVNPGAVLQQIPNVLNLLEPRATSALIASMLLYQPADAKLDNFRLVVNKPAGGAIVSCRIVGIDNDRGLDFPVVKRESNHHEVTIKNTLYCIPSIRQQMFHPEIRTQLVDMPATAFMMQWVSALIIREQACQQSLNCQVLLPEDITRLSGEACDIPLHLSPQLMTFIYQKYQEFQSALAKDHYWTHEALLAALYPVVSAVYQRLNTRFPEPGQAEKSLYEFINDKVTDVERAFEGELDSIIVGNKPLSEHLRAEFPIRKIVFECAVSLEETIVNLLSSLAWRELPETLQVLFLSSIAQYTQIEHLPLGKVNAQRLLNESVASLAHPKLVKLLLTSGATLGGSSSLLLIENLCQNYLSNVPRAIVLLKCIASRELLSQYDSRERTPLLHALYLTPHHKVSEATPFFSAMHYLGSDLNAVSASRHSLLDKLMLWDRPQLVACCVEMGSSICRVEVAESFFKKYEKQAEILKAKETLVMRNLALRWHLQWKETAWYRLRPHQSAPVHLNTPVSHPYITRATMPGLEYAVWNLAQHVAPTAIAPGVLVFEKGDNAQYCPAWLTRDPAGKKLYEAIDSPRENDILHRLEAESMSSLLCFAMLINPEFWHAEQFAIEAFGDGQHRLVNINTQRLFLTARENDMANAQCILFCFNDMRHQIHPSVKYRILSMNIGAVLKQWLNDVNKFLKDMGSDLTSILYPQSITRLHENLLRMKRVVAERPEVSHLELLHDLDPKSAARYEVALMSFNTTRARFKHVIDSCSQQPISPAAASSTQARASRPAPSAEEELSAVIQEYRQRNDLIQRLQEGDVKILYSVRLKDTADQLLRHIDFSKYPNAGAQTKVLQAMIHSGLVFTELFIRGCTVLDEKWLRQFLRVNSDITRIQLVNCPNIDEKFINGLSGATLLESLHIAGTTKLTQVKCQFKRLKYFHISEQKALETVDLIAPYLISLYVGNNPQLTNVKTSNKRLQQVFVHYTQIRASALQALFDNNRLIRCLDVSGLDLVDVTLAKPLSNLSQLTGVNSVISAQAIDTWLRGHCVQKLFHAARQYDLKQVHKLLYALGNMASILVNIEVDDQWTLLHVVSSQGFEQSGICDVALATVQTLLKQGIDVNATTRGRRTALHMICSSGFRQIQTCQAAKSAVLELIKYGVGVNAVDGAGLSALHLLCKFGYRKPETIIVAKEVALALVQHGAVADLKDLVGWEPLHVMCGFSDVHTIKHWLQYIVNVHSMPQTDLSEELNLLMLLTGLASSATVHPLVELLRANPLLSAQDTPSFCQGWSDAVVDDLTQPLGETLLTPLHILANINIFPVNTIPTLVAHLGQRASNLILKPLNRLGETLLHITCRQLTKQDTVIRAILSALSDEQRLSIPQLESVHLESPLLQALGHNNLAAVDYLQSCIPNYQIARTANFTQRMVDMLCNISSEQHERIGYRKIIRRYHADREFHANDLSNIMQHISLAALTPSTKRFIIDALLRFESLTHLTFNDCSPLDDATLSQFFECLPQLSHLTLRGCENVTADGLISMINRYAHSFSLYLGACSGIQPADWNQLVKHTENLYYMSQRGVVIDMKQANILLLKEIEKIEETAFVSIVSQMNVDVDMPLGEGYTALHLLAKKGQYQAISILCDNGAEPNCHNNDGDTPLDKALKYLLIQKGRDLTSYQKTLVMLIIQGARACKQPAQILAAIKPLPIKEQAVFEFGCYHGVITDDWLNACLSPEVEYLDIGNNPQLTNDCTRIIAQRCKQLKRLSIAGCRNLSLAGLAQLAPVSTLEQVEISYLQAKQWQHIEACRLESIKSLQLFDTSIPISVRGVTFQAQPDGQEFIVISASERTGIDQKEWLRIVKHYQQRILVAFENGRATAADDPRLLFSAIESNEMLIVRLALALGTSVSAPFQENRPLHFAARCDVVDIAEELLLHGADLNASLEDGRTALDLAVKRRFIGMIALLLRFGARVCERSHVSSVVLAVEQYLNVNSSGLLKTQLQLFRWHHGLKGVPGRHQWENLSWRFDFENTPLLVVSALDKNDTETARVLQRLSRDDAALRFSDQDNGFVIRELEQAEKLAETFLMRVAKQDQPVNLSSVANDNFPRFFKPAEGVSKAPQASSSSSTDPKICQQEEQLGPHLLVQSEVNVEGDALYTIKLLNLARLTLTEKQLVQTTLMAAGKKLITHGRMVSSGFTVTVEVDNVRDAKDILEQLLWALDITETSELFSENRVLKGPMQGTLNE